MPFLFLISSSLLLYILLVFGKLRLFILYVICIILPFSLLPSILFTMHLLLLNRFLTISFKHASKAPSLSQQPPLKNTRWLLVPITYEDFTVLLLLILHFCLGLISVGEKKRKNRR